MSAKLDRIGADLEKARKKRAEWDAKVKDLERRYREEENSEIHEIVSGFGAISAANIRSSSESCSGFRFAE